MRWLLLAHNLPPDPGSCSMDFGLLAAELIRTGHEVSFAGPAPLGERAAPDGFGREVISSWAPQRPRGLEKALQRLGEVTPYRRDWRAVGAVGREVQALVDRTRPDVVLCNHTPVLMEAVSALDTRTAVWMKGMLNLTGGGHLRRRVSAVFRRGWGRRKILEFDVAAFQWGPCPPREEWGAKMEEAGKRAVDLLPGPQPSAVAGESPVRLGRERMGIAFLGTRAPSFVPAIRLLAAGIASVPGLARRVSVHLAGPGTHGHEEAPALLDAVDGLEWTDRRERVPTAEADDFVRSHPVGLTPGNGKAPNSTGKILRMLAAGRAVLAFGLAGFADANLAAAAGCGPPWGSRPTPGQVGAALSNWADRWEAGDTLVDPDWEFVRGLCIDRQVAGLVAAAS